MAEYINGVKYIETLYIHTYVHTHCFSYIITAYFRTDYLDSWISTLCVHVEEPFTTE